VSIAPDAASWLWRDYRRRNRIQRGKYDHEMTAEIGYIVTPAPYLSQNHNDFTTPTAILNDGESLSTNAVRNVRISYH